jgi:hypothetical protein
MGIDRPVGMSPQNPKSHFRGLIFLTRWPVVTQFVIVIIPTRVPRLPDHPARYFRALYCLFFCALASSSSPICPIANCAVRSTSLSTTVSLHPCLRSLHQGPIGSSNWSRGIRSPTTLTFSGTFLPNRQCSRPSNTSTALGMARKMPTVLRTSSLILRRLVLAPTTIFHPSRGRSCPKLPENYTHNLGPVRW